MLNFRDTYCAAHINAISQIGFIICVYQQHYIFYLIRNGCYFLCVCVFSNQQVFAIMYFVRND